MFTQIWLRACPKCHGDLVLEQDYYGVAQTCIQCGFSREMTMQPKSSRRLAAASVTKAA